MARSRFCALLVSLFLVSGLSFAAAQNPRPKGAPASKKADPAPKADPAALKKAQDEINREFDERIQEAGAKAKAAGQPDPAPKAAPEMPPKAAGGVPKAVPVKPKEIVSPGAAVNKGVKKGAIPTHFVVMPGYVSPVEILNLKAGIAITRYALPNGEGFGTIGVPGMHIMPLPVANVGDFVVVVMDEEVKGMLGYSTPTGQAKPPFVDIKVFRDPEKPSKAELEAKVRTTATDAMIKGVMVKFDIPPMGSDHYKWYQPIFGSPEELEATHTKAYWENLQAALPFVKAEAQRVTGITLPPDAEPIVRQAVKAATKKGRGRTTVKKGTPAKGAAATNGAPKKGETLEAPADTEAPMESPGSKGTKAAPEEETPKEEAPKEQQ